MHKRYIYGNGRTPFLHETTRHADTTSWVVARKAASASALSWECGLKRLPPRILLLSFFSRSLLIWGSKTALPYVYTFSFLIFLRL
jgi:hypothetical protein